VVQLFVGHYTSNLRATSVESYNPATDTWTEEAPLLVGRSEPSVGRVGNKLAGFTIVAADGYASGGDTEGYDAMTNTWTTLKADPDPGGSGWRSWACTGGIGTRLYIAGGYYGGSLNESFNLSNNKWETLAPMPQAAMSTASAVYKGQLYCIGGTVAYWEEGALNNVQIYQPSEYIEGDVSKTVETTSGSPSFVGQPVTFTATVTSTHGTIPDGDLVTFFDGKTAIGTGATASGVATFVTSSLKAETHTIKAAYSGDDTFEPSSGLVKQVVDKYPTTTTLSSSPNPSQLGQTVIFTATVRSAGPTPTGKVKFMDGTKALGSRTLSSGAATLTTSKLAVGSHSITAEYTGDDGSAESTSPVLDQVVQ